MIDRQAQYNMVEQQIRPWGVLAAKVLDVFTAVPRENFVPAAHKSLAYMDMQIPIGQDEKMLEPKIEARMLQALDITPDNVILEIGTGSGFVTALLAKLAKKVVSVEINDKLLEFGKNNLEESNITNIKLKHDDALTDEFKIQGLFDVIVLTGSTTKIPEHLTEILKIGGRMFAMLQNGPLALAVKITKLSKDELLTEELFETTSVPLKETTLVQTFSF